MNEITSYIHKFDTLGEKDKYKNVIHLKSVEGKRKVKIELNEELYKRMEETFATYSQYLQKKDTYLITAVRNLIKKTNFLELYQHLLEEQISEDEFKNELDNKPKRYTIELNELDDPEDFIIIADIAQKIIYDLKEFSISEVCEIFSIDEESFIESSKLISDKK